MSGSGSKQCFSWYKFWVQSLLNTSYTHQVYIVSWKRYKIPKNSTSLSTVHFVICYALSVYKKLLSHSQVNPTLGWNFLITAKLIFSPIKQSSTFLVYTSHNRSKKKKGKKKFFFRTFYDSYGQEKAEDCLIGENINLAVIRKFQPRIGLY